MWLQMNRLLEDAMLLKHPVDMKTTKCQKATETIVDLTYRNKMTVYNLIHRKVSDFLIHGNGLSKHNMV